LDTNGDQPKPHGGVAPVYLPLAGSPLIAHVDASFCDTIDQRRVGRPLWPENCATGSVDIANAVLVVRNPGSLSTGDGNVLAQIQTIFGADRVSVFPDVFQGPATFPGVVVISGSVSDANIGTHFRNLGQGVVVLKQSLYDEMNMTNSSATSSEGTFSASSLRIFGTGDTFNSDHFTAIGSASGFTSGGYTTVNNDPAVTASTAQFGWGAAGQFARTDGAIPAALNNLGIFHYEQGQTMFHSFVAPAPRIGFFANDATAGALSTAGKRLLQEAVIVGTHGDF
ncbi:MAG TPA: hypothetical protein VFH73_12020, partial [Polyangia bacterium]|nr:hypothetical protein [Polyangia bacterium]